MIDNDVRLLPRQHHRPVEAELLASPPPRSVVIVIDRYGLGGTARSTQGKPGISAQRVQHIEQAALEALHETWPSRTTLRCWLTGTR